MTSQRAGPGIPPRPAPDQAGIDPRERLVRIAYELFTRHGLAAVGVDRIVAEAGVAKTTLYRHFRSKDDLIAEVLKRHHELWLRDWLEPDVYARGAGPAERLLAVFESLEKWFGEKDFRGCLFINSLTETHDRSSAVGRVAVRAIEDVYLMLERLAVEAGAREPSHLARQIHLLMRGSIIAAVEGRPDAGTEARAAARHLLEQARLQT